MGSLSNKERVIYAPDELLSLTRDYLGKIAAVFPGSAALFVDRKGGDFLKTHTNTFLSIVAMVQG